MSARPGVRHATPDRNPPKHDRPVLVTGASGHLGANLVRRLLDEGYPVRVLLREGSDRGAVEGLAVERVFGDLRDFPATRAAVAGCGRIYHCAAKLSTIEGEGGLRRIRARRRRIFRDGPLQSPTCRIRPSICPSDKASADHR
ncbi:MAG: NAD-dependent epimerase/dehydratase family protein [Blastocatellia bacterium]|nr:NAD-dependent epimerase/dehydratase family protein [Blastocatellia bacterium]